MSRKKKQKRAVSQEVDYDKVISIGLPLPEVLEYSADVSMSTRKCLEQMYGYMRHRGFDLHEFSEKGINVANNHNELARKMVGDWLLICGSDHTFAPDALELLWDAAHKPPYPKIVGACIPHRHAPHAYVATMMDEYGERPSAILPFVDFHPAQTLKSVGAVVEVGTIGSGFCLYHRSVFDQIPYPWFLFATRGIPKPEAEASFRDFTDNQTFPQFLEELANGNRPISGMEAEELRKKATQMRRALARVRAPFAYGPDYHINVAAKDYGIKTYMHLGVTVFHLAFVAIHNGHYLVHLRENRSNWWAAAMRSKPATTQNIQEVRKIVESLDYQRNMGPEELINDFDRRVADAEGNRIREEGDEEGRQEAPETAQEEEVVEEVAA